MTDKTLTTIIVVFICIILFPIGIGLIGGLFGVVIGIFGSIIGVIGSIIGGVIGAIGSVFGWIFGAFFGLFHWNIFLLVIVCLIIVLVARPRNRG